MKTERDVFIDEHGGIKNGYYERAMKTKLFEIWYWRYECTKGQGG